MTERATYTIPELADYWNCSTDIIYDLLHSGKLQGFKLGRAWRISDDARKQYENSPAKPEPKLRGTGRRVARIT